MKDVSREKIELRVVYEVDNFIVREYKEEEKEHWVTLEMKKMIDLLDSFTMKSNSPKIYHNSKNLIGSRPKAYRTRDQ